MGSVDLICLANSRKHSGRCVAGLRLDGGGWVRPVAAVPDGTLFPDDFMLPDLTEPGPLDVIRVGLSAPRPSVNQPENCVIDGSAWSLVSRPVPPSRLDLLRPAVSSGLDLLGGPSDRVTWDRLQRRPAPASLTLVAPDRVRLYSRPNAQGRVQVRGLFPLGGQSWSLDYDLVVTEVRTENLVMKQGERTLRQSERPFCLTISLGEPIGGVCYKLIAAVIALPHRLTLRS